MHSLAYLSSLQDCALWSKTVAPYWPHIGSISKQLGQVRSLQALQALYTQHNPLILAVVFSVIVGVVVLIVGEINNNYSQIDRLWSILPTVYAAHYCYWAHVNGLPATKLDLALLASAVWSVRLTYNYWRRGGYQVGSEDYRWKIVEKRIGRAAFCLLNMTFISFMQSALLCLVTSPIYVLLNTTNLSPPSIKSANDPIDLYWTIGIIAWVSVEYIADQQQWDFHQAKHEYQNTARVPAHYGHTRAELDRGFLSTGLFAYSRHPNYVCEIAVWATFYAWGCCASETTFNWTLGPLLAYVAVFLSSTPLTEAITGAKYPEYREYRKRVGMLLPNPVKMLRGGFKGRLAKKTL